MKTPLLQSKKNRLVAFRALYFFSLILLLGAVPRLVRADPLPRFRILIDTNQMNISEINQLNQSTFYPLATDGVWAVVQNNCGLNCGFLCVNDNRSQTNQDVPPDAWLTVLPKLNGANWTATEDEAIHGPSNYPTIEVLNNNDYAAALGYIGRAPHESLAYWEYFPLPKPRCSDPENTNCDNEIISPEEITNLAKSGMFNDRIIFLSRSFRGPANDPASAAYWVQEGLNSPDSSGVVFEINPGSIVNDGELDFNKAVEGINYTLGLGKNCYLLLPPNHAGAAPFLHRNNHGGPPDYANDILEVITYLHGKVPLNDPRLFIVLAVYGRDELPPPRPSPSCSPAPTPPGYVKSSPGFLTGDGTTGYNNSVLAAARALQTFRNSHLPQATMGYLDIVNNSVASGWTLDPQTFAASAEAIMVHLYVDGETFAGAVAANMPRPDVNAATGFLGDHGFHVPIPPQYLDGQPHAWDAWAISASGQPTLLGNSPMTVTLYDTTPPTVAITAPWPGQNVRGTAVTVSANASDNRGVVGVQFRVDGANLGTEDSNPPYSTSWNTTTTSDGNHMLTAVARDAAPNMTTSVAIPVIVDNTPPTGVNVTAPFSGQNVRGVVTISGSAFDANFKGIQFTVDGSNVGGLDKVAPYTFSWDTVPVPDGVHTVRAVAHDQAGNTTTSDPVTVIVDNTPPTGVAVTSPANGTQVGGLITVTGVASDANIKGIQFTLDGGNLGTLDKTVPYSVPWNTLMSPQGPHTLRAVAHDQAGNTTISPPITVTVNNGS